MKAKTKRLSVAPKALPKPKKLAKKFLVIFPWVDLAKGETSDEYARVTFGEIEARSLPYARLMVADVVDDGGALLDLLIEPGTKREVLPGKKKGLLGESGVVLGTPIVVPLPDIGTLDFDWALAYFTPKSARPASSNDAMAEGRSAGRNELSEGAGEGSLP